MKKTAIVTGASSGIGRATALALAGQGARVVLVARSEEKLIEVAHSITAMGEESLVVPTDVTDAVAREMLVKTAVSHFGSLDVLVNAAGKIASGTVKDTTLSNWQEMFSLNVEAVFHLMNLAVPHLIRTKGAIVNVSSVTGIRSFPGILSYCTSKAAVDQLTHCAALELAKEGVRVNAVNPGVVVTEMHRSGGLSDDNYRKFLEHSQSTHPMGRVGSPEEVAQLILFLASSDAGWITGTSIPIDGGRHLTCAR